MLKLIWLATFCAAVATAVTAESDQTQIIQKHPNEITDIPGLQCNLKSRHYGGYITVDADNNRNLYYYFVTSKRKPAKDPLILWLNGGPGCSSFDGTPCFGAAHKLPYLLNTCMAKQASSMSTDLLK